MVSERFDSVEQRRSPDEPSREVFPDATPSSRKLAASLKNCQTRGRQLELRSARRGGKNEKGKEVERARTDHQQSERQLPGRGSELGVRADDLQQRARC